MLFKDITYDLNDGVAVIVLNRPENLNGMTANMRGELLNAISMATAKARVIMLTGAGRGFCSGQDLGAGKSVADVDPARVLREEYEPILRAIYESPIPIICAVNGPAAGAGANLALACDIVIAARSAYFMEAFSRIGLMPDAGGTWHLPRQVGLARAMGMAMFGDAIPAAQAAEWGLIWEVTEDEDLLVRAGELAARLATGPTRAYASIRKALREATSNDYFTQLEREAEMQAELGETNDFAEGVMAFLQKRKPQFNGR
ncbi:MAG: enoyl-CoA hydratase-related protein [Pikeienuella sp.]